jgi:biotin carboxylase
MSKTLLVLAASTYQIPVIETAKRLGYRVITTDNDPTNPGHVLADASFRVDTTDLDGILALAVKENIAGIIAPCTDVAVSTAAHVAEQLHLPGPTYDSAQTLTHKQYFREFLARAGFACPRAFLLANNASPEIGLFDGRKWLVKPSCSSGSKGIFIVRSEAELLFRVSESRAFSIDGSVILEEFIEGTQHTCEGILKEGKFVLALLTDRDTAPPPYTATTGHRVPSLLPEVVQNRVLSIIEEVLGRLGVTSGPFDCDFVADRENITLIEITPRLGGNSLSGLIKAALDFDLVAYAVNYACGDTFPLPSQRFPKPSAIAILGVDQPGRLTWNESEAEALLRESWVDTLLFDLPQGTSVEPFINGRHRVGEALITGTNRNEVDARLIELQRRLALRAI